MTDMAILIADVISYLLSQYVWPVVYTIGGVFIALYLNGIVDTERDRTAEILRPLHRETELLNNCVSTEPLRPLEEPSGDISSIVLDFDSIDFVQFNPELYELTTSYMEALQELSELHQPHVPVARVLDKAGYSDHLRQHLPEELLLPPSEGVDPSRRPDFPGPQICAGEVTVGGGYSEYFETGHQVPVRTKHSYPLLALILEEFDAIAAADGPDDIRMVIERNTEMDLAYMDSQCDGWASALWTALTTPFESTETIVETESVPTDGPASQSESSIITGATVKEIVYAGESAVRLRQIQARQAVIDAAGALYGRLSIRLGLRIYDPRRLRRAAATQVYSDLHSR